MLIGRVYCCIRAPVMRRVLHRRVLLLQQYAARVCSVSLSVVCGVVTTVRVVYSVWRESIRGEAEGAAAVLSLTCVRSMDYKRECSFTRWREIVTQTQTPVRSVWENLFGEEVQSALPLVDYEVEMCLLYSDLVVFRRKLQR